MDEVYDEVVEVSSFLAEDGSYEIYFSYSKRIGGKLMEVKMILVAEVLIHYGEYN